MQYNINDLCESLSTPLKSILIALQENKYDKASDICNEALKNIQRLNPMVKIVRLEQTEEGALGTLILDGYLFCSTLEPDAGDANKSQIPEGAYLCKMVESPKFGNTFEVMVPGHTNVLFHPGNTEEDTSMCILLGQYPGKLRHNRAVLNSGLTHDKFMAVFGLKKRSQFYAEFINCY